MLPELTAEHEAFRDKLCDFLRTELKAEARTGDRNEHEHGGWAPEYRRAFRRRLGELGFIGVSWPTEYGGGGRDVLYQLIYAEEIEYHSGPGLEPAVTYVPPVLIMFGSHEQKEHFLPRLRRGELSVFLGYSEPEAGSDLANLRTEAVSEAGHFVITGQKSYSSYANLADYGLIAARTKRSDSRHSGISLFLVDMTTPGIAVSHHRTVAGFDHPSVYFDHVAVPGNMVVGPLHEGWRVLMAAIDFERASLAAPGLVDHQLDRLFELGCRTDAQGGRRLDDRMVRDRLVTLAVEAEAARLYAYWVAQLQVQGEQPRHETSLSLLLKRETARLADVLGIELLGPYAQLRGGTPHAQFEGAIEQEYREHLFFHFAAGGFDITRNVIAVRGLRLPR
jgi:alkylation response protein AidB-like acyl-CoA dehydrogenase